MKRWILLLELVGKYITMTEGYTKLNVITHFWNTTHSIHLEETPHSPQLIVALCTILLIKLFSDCKISEKELVSTNCPVQWSLNLDICIDKGKFCNSLLKMYINRSPHWAHSDQNDPFVLLEESGLPGLLRVQRECLQRYFGDSDRLQTMRRMAWPWNAELENGWGWKWPLEASELPWHKQGHLEMVVQHCVQTAFDYL